MDDLTPNGQMFLEKLKKRVAKIAIDSSTARNMGSTGLINSGRSFLGGRLDFEIFSRLEPVNYPAMLDKLTEGMQSSLHPFLRRGDGWGPARKFINIFLRDVFYNFYLRNAYNLERFESVLEIPLDSYVAHHLRQEPEGDELPKWATVIALTAESSKKFQNVAGLVATRLKTHPMHLDLIYWQKPSI